MKEVIALIKEVLEHLPDKEIDGSWDSVSAQLLLQAIAILEGV